MFTFIHFSQGSSVLYSLIYVSDLLLQSATFNMSQTDHLGDHVNVCQIGKNRKIKKAP